jgi:hypothetical protein
VIIAVWAAITIAMTLSIGVPTGYPGQVAVFTGLALIEVSATFNIWRIVVPWSRRTGCCGIPAPGLRSGTPIF